jgi:membrane-bound lytic murein transglycosylase B
MRLALPWVLLALVAGCGGGGEQRVASPAAAPPTPSPTATATATATATPGPEGPLPDAPEALAGDLARTRGALWAAIDRWRADGDPGRDGIPEAVTGLAQRQQRIYRRLGRERRLSHRVLAALPVALRAEARDNVLARLELERIVSQHVGPPPKVAIGSAQPADVLRGHYRRAHRRFRVGAPLLAAVNFIESAFGRLRNRSVSGARGPMQFMPATWASYGLGGDISDPRDAILGAANYLHANGAPGSDTRALFRYNPSADYVSAVSRYARRIRADWRAFYAYYAWEIHYRGKRFKP